jgi:hypothetical protein
MKPNGTMRTHDHHAINYNSRNQPPGKILKQEKEKERKQAKRHKAAGHGNPILFCFENIHS